VGRRLRKLAPTLPPNAVILMNLSGRGDKDVAQVAELLTREETLTPS
jgi:tryptophan synthase beta subunit